jgi:hypothetical protein
MWCMCECGANVPTIDQNYNPNCNYMCTRCAADGPLPRTDCISAVNQERRARTRAFVVCVRTRHSHKGRDCCERVNCDAPVMSDMIVPEVFAVSKRADTDHQHAAGRETRPTSKVCACPNTQGHTNKLMQITVCVCVCVLTRPR